jgi:hypothetical protein
MISRQACRQDQPRSNIVRQKPAGSWNWIRASAHRQQYAASVQSTRHACCTGAGRAGLGGAGERASKRASVDACTVLSRRHESIAVASWLTKMRFKHALCTVTSSATAAAAAMVRHCTAPHSPHRRAHGRVPRDRAWTQWMHVCQPLGCPTVRSSTLPT